MKNRSGGFVSLVGAGPGDEGLITVRGVDRLARADAVVYDYLANPKMLDYCAPDCEKIYVGKSAGAHTASQEEIHELLVNRAKRGKRVVRLKGGDPFIFGRGSEEAYVLAGEGIPFEIVPGITAGAAAPAYAGIPVTHRGTARGVTFVTGHAAAGRSEEIYADEEYWRALAESGNTLVVYMGVKNLPFIVEKLLHYGKSPQTPAALISWGTLPAQKTVTAQLSRISEEAEREAITPPAVAVIGSVVDLRETIHWFEERPLFGRRILVTRGAESAESLAAPLRDLGAEVCELPTIEIVPVEDFSELDAAIRELSSYGWIVFTSANGVRLFFSRLFGLGFDSRSLADVHVACIGTGTAERLSAYGISADLVPRIFTSEGLAQEFNARRDSLGAARVLFPCSDIARDVVPERLEAMGAQLRRITVYSAHRPDYSAERLESSLDPIPDVVTLTSSSTASNLVTLLREHGLEDRLGSLRAVSIGPVTTRTAQELGLQVVAEAEEHSIGGLIDTIRDMKELQKGNEKEA